MKYVLGALFALICLTSSANAIWEMIPLEDLVQDSDLIVIGTLSGVSGYSEEGIDYEQGTIRVEEVIWGDVAPGTVLTLKWQNPTGLICPRVEHKPNENKQGIWLLNSEGGQEVSANYPGRFVEGKEQQEIKSYLLKRKVRLRIARYGMEPDEPVNVAIVFRNPTTAQLQFPGMQYDDGILSISPNAQFFLSRGWEATYEEISPLPNRINPSDRLAPVTVEPGQEFRMNIDLRTLFRIEPPSNYVVHLIVNGHPPANTVGFFQNASKSPDHQKKQKATSSASTPTQGVGTTKVISLAGLILVLSALLTVFQIRGRAVSSGSLQLVRPTLFNH